MKYKQIIIWVASLVIGAILGSLGCEGLNHFFDFVASAYTRCFQFIAAPTVALAILTALASLGNNKSAGKIFTKTLGYTLFTSFLAALIAVLLFMVVKPGNLPLETVAEGESVKMVQDLTPAAAEETVYGHILNCLPNNIVKPLFEGNVLSIILAAAAMGLAIAHFGKENENVQTLLKALTGLQEVLFKMIRALIWALPFGIIAFAGQLAAQVKAGVVVDSIGKYVAVVLIGNLLQIFVILPIILAVRGLNPFKVFKAMSPAFMMALFTKSSAATLPVTIASAENNLKSRPAVARFILPLCCTINMNGCAAFICVTSIFVMQHIPGFAMSWQTMIVWSAVAVICAIGNAGVPMGCYFLTLSLMSAQQGAPLGIFGVILPIYAVIDMIETAENVWSDCCICAIVNKDMDRAEAKLQK